LQSHLKNLPEMQLQEKHNILWINVMFFLHRIIFAKPWFMRISRHKNKSRHSFFLIQDSISGIIHTIYLILFAIKNL